MLFWRKQNPGPLDEVLAAIDTLGKRVVCKELALGEVRRVLLVTQDYQGLLRNGGVGTAAHELAVMYAAADWNVDVMFAAHQIDDLAGFARRQRDLAWRGINLFTPPPPRLDLEGGIAACRAFAIYLALRDSQYDIIHFPDMHGLGYYCLQAKRLGQAFAQSRLIVTAHGPTEWHFEYNGEAESSWIQIEQEYMERKSIEWADLLIFPSPVIANWFQARGWKISANACVAKLPMTPMQNLIKSTPNGTFNEIVFLGRLEKRKGLDRFLEAIEALHNDGLLSKVKITLVGRPGQMGGTEALKFLKQGAGRWPELNILSELNREECLAYLAHSSAITVIPSRAETFGYTLYECLAHGFPVLATNIEAFREATPEAMREKILFAIDGNELEMKLRQTLNGQLQFSAQPVRWPVSEEWFRPRVLAQETFVLDQGQAGVAVLIHAKNESGFLLRALRSLANQTLKPAHVFVIAGEGFEPLGSELIKEALGPIPFELLPFAPSSLTMGAAMRASTEYLFLSQDDSVFAPTLLETFFHSAKSSQADIVTGPVYRFHQSNGWHQPVADSAWVPLVGDVLTGMLWNSLGDENFLVRREIFVKIGGYADDFELAQDWDFHLRAALEGYRFEMVPEPLIYRSQSAGVRLAKDLSSATLRARLANVNMNAKSTHYAPLLRMLMGRYLPPAQGQTLFMSLPNFNRSRARCRWLQFSLSPSAFRPKAIDHQNLRIEIKPDRLNLISPSDDPQIHFLTWERSSGSQYLCELEMDYQGSGETCDIYYKCEGDLTFEEDRVLRFPLNKGRHYYVAELKTQRPITGLRFDPTRGPSRTEIFQMDFWSDGLPDLASHKSLPSESSSL